MTKKLEQLEIFAGEAPISSGSVERVDPAPTADSSLRLANAIKQDAPRLRMFVDAVRGNYKDSKVERNAIASLVRSHVSVTTLEAFYNYVAAEIERA